MSRHHCGLDHFDCASADSMLRRKLKRANAGLHNTKKVYDEHCIYVGEEQKKLYEERETKAQLKRGKALEIYQASTADRQSMLCLCCITNFS